MNCTNLLCTNIIHTNSIQILHDQIILALLRSSIMPTPHHPPPMKKIYSVPYVYTGA